MKRTLNVNLATGSHLLRTKLPIEVRDARLRLVDTLVGSGEVQLDPGVYRVSAVLDDGREHVEIVTIDAVADASSQSLTLGERVRDEPDARGWDSVVEHMVLPARTPSRFTKQVVGVGEGGWTWSFGIGGQSYSDQLDLPTGWLAFDEPRPFVPTFYFDVQQHAWTHDDWGFRASGQKIGMATFGNSRWRWSVSLPVFVGRHPETLVYLDDPTARRGDAPDCIVRPDTASPDARPLALIAPWRMVASAMQHMLVERRYAHAAKVAEAASDLLLYKYQDPVAAALGALVLYRIGRLGEHAAWVDNLARDFPWLPDGRILKAALLFAKADDASGDEAVELLLSCIGDRASYKEERVLFTDSYSLLIEGLRRYRAKPRYAARCGPALEQLADTYPHVEWDLPTFTVRRPQ
jgi:hypothetical protein